jgi:hypothetical protein
MLRTVYSQRAIEMKLSKHIAFCSVFSSAFCVGCCICSKTMLAQKNDKLLA